MSKQKSEMVAVASEVDAQSIGAVAESQRSMAEIQAALTIAAARPRDEVRAIERIRNACARPGLAQNSQYAYSRGGQEITGPSIDLLTAIAGCWGNLQFGFRVLADRKTESEVEAFAWDLETNTKRTVVFTVAHKRDTKTGSKALTDSRDVYEMQANMAQRRVRACLEAIIPSDVVDDAVAMCNETLKHAADVTPDAVAKLIKAFAGKEVTRAMLEKWLGRRAETMAPAQLMRLRAIYKSLSDGMSMKEDWFGPSAQTAAEVASAINTPAPLQWDSTAFLAELKAATTAEQIDAVEAKWAASLPEDDPRRADVAGECDAKRAAIKGGV